MKGAHHAPARGVRHGQDNAFVRGHDELRLIRRRKQGQGIEHLRIAPRLRRGEGDQRLRGLLQPNRDSEQPGGRLEPEGEGARRRAHVPDHGQAARKRLPPRSLRAQIDKRQRAGVFVELNAQGFVLDGVRFAQNRSPLRGKFLNAHVVEQHERLTALGPHSKVHSPSAQGRVEEARLNARIGVVFWPQARPEHGARGLELHAIPRLRFKLELAHRP